MVRTFFSETKFFCFCFKILFSNLIYVKKYLFSVRGRWQVDLGAATELASLHAWHRSSAAFRVTPCWVLVFDHLPPAGIAGSLMEARAAAVFARRVRRAHGEGELCVAFEAGPGGAAVRGRYVRLQCEGTRALLLNHVHVRVRRAQLHSRLPALL